MPAIMGDTTDNGRSETGPNHLRNDDQRSRFVLLGQTGLLAS